MHRPSRLHLLLLAASVVALVVLALRFESSSDIEVIRREAPGAIDQIVVHVSGEVRTPGIYVVSPGDRVGDAVDMAGGLTADADAGAVNLALRLRDEDHIQIPAMGEGDSHPRTVLLDLNSATADQLEDLPGIGPVYAGRIIDARTLLPFGSSDELLEREVIPAHVYEEIRLLVTTVYP